jgi:hypothetical protein
LTPARPKRRIDSKKDWVRIELESALRRHRLVVPLLLDETHMPKARLLPDSLRELAFIQGQTVRESTFDTDLRALIEELRKACSHHERESSVRLSLRKTDNVGPARRWAGPPGRERGMDDGAHAADLGRLDKIRAQERHRNAG